VVSAFRGSVVTVPPPRLGIGRAIAGHVFGLVLALALSFVSLTQLRRNSERMNRLIDREAADVVQFQRLTLLSERIGRTGQKFLNTGRRELLTEARAARAEMNQVLTVLGARADGEAARAALAEVVRLTDQYSELLDRALEARGQGGDVAVLLVDQEVQPAREALDGALRAATALEVRDLADARRRASEQSNFAYNLLLGGTAVAVAVAVLMTLLLVRILTALARSRSELSSTLTLLEQRNQDLDAFAGRVAHDLRNILAPLPIAAANLRARRDRPEDIDALTDRVVRAGVRATAFLDTLLAFARSGRGVSEPYTGASVRAAVAASLDSLAGLREEMRAEVETDIEDASVGCAPGLLLAVTTNLLSNAFKFLDGRSQRRVRVSARARDGACQISVEDSGPGIAPQHQSRLFEPFYRTPGSRAPGSGLGLATVHRIVEAAGGSISVTSRVDEGTRFVVTLPAVVLPSATPAPAEAARNPASPPGLAPS
jgi:signal transduction histidine kinase